MVTLTANAERAGSATRSRTCSFRWTARQWARTDTTAPYSYDWDSTTVADGAHQITAVVTDSANQTATSAPVSLTVNNGSSGSFAVTLSADQLFPKPTTTATGTGNFTVDTSSGALSGNIELNGITPTGAEIGDAYAGAHSTAMITLTMDNSNPDQWDVPAGTTLNAQQLADLNAGKIYVLVRSAACPRRRASARSFCRAASSSSLPRSRIGAESRRSPLPPPDRWP